MNDIISTGRNETRNLQNLIYTFLSEKLSKVKNYTQLIMLIEDKFEHDRYYAVNITKLKNIVDRKSDKKFDTEIIKTLKLYLNELSI